MVYQNKERFETEIATFRVKYKANEIVVNTGGNVGSLGVIFQLSKDEAQCFRLDFIIPTDFDHLSKS